MSKRFVCEQGLRGLRLTVRSEWSPEASELIRTKGIREVELNQSKGWHGTNVDFLRELPSLEAITIIDFSINDILGIQAQTKLKYLDLNTYAKTPIDFSSFKLLQECSLEWNQKFVKFFELSSLQRTFLNKFPDSDFERLSRLTSLTELSLASPGLTSLRGLERLDGLRSLGIYEARKLESIDGVEALKQLDILEINGCKRISNISPISGLTGLQRLLLCNDGEIESLSPLLRLDNLEEFLFYESTNVRDGDLGVLKRLASLKNVAFMDRKHYSHLRSEFMP